MDGKGEQLLRWENFLNQNIADDELLNYQEEIAAQYVDFMRSKSTKSTYEEGMLERALVLCLEKATKSGYNANALPKLVEAARLIGARENDFFAKSFTERLARYISNLIACVVQSNNWQNAVLMASEWEKIPVKATIKEKFLMARVWEHVGHWGWAKKYYKEALFHKRAETACFCFTPYTLLLSMLLLPDWRKTAFILGGYIRGEIIENFKNSNISGLYHLETAGNVDRFRDILKAFSVWAKNNNILFMGQDNMNEAAYFIDENFNVVEDGLGNYYISRVCMPLEDGHEHMCYGFDDRIKNIYLLGRTTIPEQIKHKVTIVNLQEKWNSKGIDEQAEILDILAVPIKKIIDLINSGRDHIFLTQHFFNEYDEERKRKHIVLCKKILSNYDHKRVIIKVHPSRIEPVDYERLFPDCYIMNDSFPIEILKLVGLEGSIAKIISVMSTASYGFFDKSKTDFYLDLFSEIMHDDPECERILYNISGLPR